MTTKVYGERWETIEPLGEGGQAHTYKVKDLKGEGDTRYVLKRLKNIERVERFKREIEAVRGLSHENIVQLIDFDLEADRPYLVTEYCSGGSLEKADSAWYSQPAKAFELFREICQGVAHAHARKIVHRDLKPANIFLRTKDGPAVVGDFGICHLMEGGRRLTLTDEAVGPIHFMAPELEDGRSKAVSYESDVYSLGKLLYWLLSRGDVFSREKHRERDWDLKHYKLDTAQGLGWDNIYMEHVNRLLDLMIVADPEQRRTVDDILIFLKQVVRVVEKEFSPIARNLEQPCVYCGYGRYIQQASGVDLATKNFGMNLPGNPDWRVLVCNKCGHVQWFRVDLAAEKDWWK